MDYGIDVKRQHSCPNNRRLIDRCVDFLLVVGIENQQYSLGVSVYINPVGGNAFFSERTGFFWILWPNPSTACPRSFRIHRRRRVNAVSALLDEVEEIVVKRHRRIPVGEVGDIA